MRAEQVPQPVMDAKLIKKKYRRNAPFYDPLLGHATRRLREKAIAKLALHSGEVILDFGCGTGLSFDLLKGAVGSSGHIIGVDLSTEMLARARERAARDGWTNVTLIEANAEEVELQPESVDAMLCFYTHDIMTSRRALEEAVKALRPGGRSVAAGVKRASEFPGRLLNLVTLTYSRPFITNPSDASRPWTHLESLLGPLDVEEHQLGTAYLAHGVKPRR